MNNAIKEKRMKLGLTLKDLADKVGVTSSTISRWETGNIVNIRKDNLLALSEALNAPPFEILGYDDDENYNIPQIEEYKSSKYKLFPCSISAGYLQQIEAIADYTLVPISDSLMGKYAKKEYVILLKVNGDSMNRLIPDGSIIFVDTSVNRLEYMNNNDIIVFFTEEGYSIKRFFHDVKLKKFIFKPYSYDEFFVPIEIPYENSYSLRIVGKVIKYLVDL